jgi:hypothetical protein
MKVCWHVTLSEVLFTKDFCDLLVSLEADNLEYGKKITCFLT